MSNLGSWEIASGSSGVVCIHTFYTPSNRLVCIERPHENPYPFNSNTGGNPASEIELTTNEAGSLNVNWKSLPIASNAFCAGHSQLGDGSVLIVGGDARTDTGLIDGRRSVRKFTPCNNASCSFETSISELYQMTSERWYPTVVTLKDGNAIIISGTKDNLDFGNLSEPIQNPTYEYYPPKTEGEWPRKLNLLEWAFPFVLYPMAFQLPSGNLFLFVSNKSIIIDTQTDQTIDLPDLLVPNHLPFIYPYSPHMLMLPLTLKNKYAVTLLLCGGSELPPQETTPLSSKQCFKINPEDPKPTWVKEDDMPIERVMLDGVILPDGKILYVNGASWGLAGGSQAGDTSVAGGPVFDTSLYDPEAPAGSKWSSLPKSQVPRLYHSGAILTTEGYIVTTGSEMQNYADNDPNCFPQGLKNVCTSPYEYRIEKYTPYYLTTGKPRPVLISAPAEISYNSTVLIEIQSGTTIDRVTFIRYSTTTHYTNTDQRFIELEIIGTADGKVGIRMPVNGALAPPGNWMLFVLKEGVPSVAKTILLEPGEQQNIPEDVFKILKKKTNSADRIHGSTLMVMISMLLLALA